MAALGSLVAGVAGNYLGHKLGSSLVGNNSTTTQGAAVPQAVMDSAANPINDTQAGILRSTKRRVQAQDLSLFNLNSNNNNQTGL